MITLNQDNIKYTDVELTISNQGYPFWTMQRYRIEHPLLPSGFMVIDSQFGYDGASIPGLATIRVGSGKNPTHLKSALPHDKLYRDGRLMGISRKTADIIYRDFLRACGVSNYKSNLEYWSVRLRGKKHYK